MASRHHVRARREKEFINHVTKLLLAVWTDLVIQQVSWLRRPGTWSKISPDNWTQGWKIKDKSIRYQWYSMVGTGLGVAVAIVIGISTWIVACQSLNAQVEPGPPTYVAHFRKVVKLLCEGHKNKLEDSISQEIPAGVETIEEASVTCDKQGWITFTDHNGNLKKVDVMQLLSLNAMCVGVFYPKGCAKSEEPWASLNNQTFFISFVGADEKEDEKPFKIPLRDVIRDSQKLKEEFANPLYRGHMVNIDDPLFHELENQAGGRIRAYKVKFWLG